MQVQPYLFFDGRCEEAFDFYRRALGAEVTMLMRFKDSPEPSPPGMVPPGAENKVMHASLRRSSLRSPGRRVSPAPMLSEIAAKRKGPALDLELLTKLRSNG
jgi:PhnB protein